MLRKTLYLLIVIALFLMGSYAYLVYRKPPLNEDIRKTLPGSFVRLTRGVVHYELDGPEDGPVVVLVHGLTTPYFIWDKTFPTLVEAGFRVLRYDLYGRGLSDRPHLKYNSDLFDFQLLELVKILKLRTPIHLVGLSMGGAVAVTFTDRHPKLVSRVCLIAPFGFPVRVPLVRKLALVPLLGDYIMAVAGERIIKKGVRSSLYRFDQFPEFMEKFEEQLRYRGYKGAILSTLRNMPLEPIMASYRRVGMQKRPIMLIWGRQDAILPFSLSEKVREAIPNIIFYPIDQAGHSAHYDRPEAVNPLIIRFLKGSEL